MPRNPPWPRCLSRASKHCAKSITPRRSRWRRWNWSTRPGLSRTHEGNAVRLATIREAGCLVLVVSAFDSGSNALADVDALQEDFLLADLEIVTGRIERLRESTEEATPRPRCRTGRVGRVGTDAQGLGIRHAAVGRRNERRAAQGHALVSLADGEIQAGARQRGRRRERSRALRARAGQAQSAGSRRRRAGRAGT